jgi:DNA-binding CsgD family transcriptional regulator
VATAPELRHDLLDTVEQLSVPSYVLDRDCIVRWLNSAGRAFFGNVIGKHFTTLAAHEYPTKTRTELARKINGTPATDYEVALIDHRGHAVPAQLSSVALKNGHVVVGVFGLVRRDAGSERGPAPRHHALTPRQAEVLRLLADGASTEQLATTLHVSKDTIHNHVTNILRALGAHSRLEAVAIARRDGLLG